MGIRKKTVKSKRMGRPRILGPRTTTNGLSVLPSLPPVAPESQPNPPSSEKDGFGVQKWTSQPPKGHPDRSWWLPQDSTVRQTALHIIAMRISGLEDDEIAKQLDISRSSISAYVYRATKNGWLDITYDPAQRVRLQTMHKVVERLEEGLDSPAVMATGMPVRTHMALKIAEGTIFKSFDEQKLEVAPNTLVAIQIQMPEGAPQQIREDTTGGIPAFIDAVVEK